MMRHFDSISKKELATAVADRTGITRVLALKIIGELIEEIKRQYFAGNRIELRGLGTFNPVRRKGRKYRIPRIANEQITTDHITMKFKASKRLSVKIKCKDEQI